MISQRVRRATSAIAAAAVVLSAAIAPGVAVAAAGLSLTTDYPIVTVRPESRTSLNLAVETDAPARINLEVSGVPDGWTASLHGGGFVIGGVQTDGSEPTAARLDVDVPAGATGTHRLVVAAFDATSRVELPIDVTVEANAGGEIRLSTDFNALRGAADSTFTFNLNISNGKEEDLTYSATGQGPVGWSVEAKPTGQSQAVSGTVQAGGTAGINVTVEAPDSAAAGTYDLLVVATVGGEQIEQPLQVEITGSYSLDLTTPTQVLSARGPSGGVTEQVFTLINDGTAPVTGVQMTASPPTNWKVEFEPATIDSIPPNTPVTVTARITPAGDAIAGDYSLTVRANGEEADADTELRFTVEASILGAVIGGVLIIAAVGGLLWVFRRYGRR